MADTEILGRATVEFRAVAVGQDTGDDGTIPEDTPLEGVRVRLTPSPRKVEVAAGGIDGTLPAKPTTFTLREWELVTDAEGYLLNPAAVVTTTEYPHGTPESLAAARTIEIVASDAIDGVSVQWTSVVDAPDSGVPAIAKVWLAPAGSTVDLTTVESIPPSPGSLAEYLQAVQDARAARDIAVASGAAASAAAASAAESARLALLAADVAQVTLTGNLAYALPVGTPANTVHRVTFTQDGVGGHTVTYGGQPITVDLTAGASTTVEFVPVGAGYVVRYATAAGLALLTGADASAQRASLGLGSASTAANADHHLAAVVKTGTLVDSFNGKTTWTQTTGTGTVTATGRELTITTTGTTTVTAKRVVALDLTRRFLSFDILRDTNLETFDVKIATGTDADTNGWRVNENVTKINAGEWYTYTLPLSQAAVMGTATAADLDDVQAIRFVANPAAGVDTTVKIRNLRSHPYAIEPAVHWLFDDGRADTYSVAAPILSDYGYTGGIAVEYNRVGSAGRCTLAQLAELYGRGWSMYGHHTIQATDLSDVDAEAVMVASRAWSDSVGFVRGSAHWVWPGGARDAAKEAIAKKYWRTMRRVGAHHQFAAPHVYEPLDPSHVYINTAATLANTKNKIDAAAERGGAIVFVFHSLVDSKTEQEDWLVSDFTSLVAYAREKGMADTNLDQLFGSSRPVVPA